MNTRSKSFRTEVARFLSGAALIILFALFLVPDAFAAKPEPGACKPHPKKPDRCGPAGHGMPPGNSAAARLNGEFYESGSRRCDSEGQPMNTRGNYECETANSVAVSFHELGNPVASRKNLSWMCDALNVDFDGDHLGLSLESYIYGWTDACDDGSCGVEIRLLSRDPLIRTITFGRSDQVEITLFAEATGLDDDDYPFNEGLTLDIHSIETDYKKTGSTRSAVICHHDLISAQMPVTFRTDPD
jgi:hypothetical protein